MRTPTHYVVAPLAFIALLLSCRTEAAPSKEGTPSTELTWPKQVTASKQWAPFKEGTSSEEVTPSKASASWTELRLGLGAVAKSAWHKLAATGLVLADRRREHERSEAVNPQQEWIRPRHQQQEQQRQREQQHQGEEEDEAEEPMEDFFQNLVLRHRPALSATWQTQVSPLTSFWKHLTLRFLLSLPRKLICQLASHYEEYGHYSHYKQYRQDRQYSSTVRRALLGRSTDKSRGTGEYMARRLFIDSTGGTLNANGKYRARRSLSDSSVGTSHASTGDGKGSSRVLVKRFDDLPSRKCAADPLASVAASDLKASETVNWAPTQGRYLLPICQFGRLSNQVC